MDTSSTGSTTVISNSVLTERGVLQYKQQPSFALKYHSRLQRHFVEEDKGQDDETLEEEEKKSYEAEMLRKKKQFQLYSSSFPLFRRFWNAVKESKQFIAISLLVIFSLVLITNLVVEKILLPTQTPFPIGNEIDSVLKHKRFDPAEARPTELSHCRHTNQGKQLIIDELGYTCSWKNMDPLTGCCKTHEKALKYSCETCNATSKCCDTFEYCASCCLSPDKEQINEILTILNSTENPILQNTDNIFDFCISKCRTNSLSIYQHKYRNTLKYCYGQGIPFLNQTDPTDSYYPEPGYYQHVEEDIIQKRVQIPQNEKEKQREEEENDKQKEEQIEYEKEYEKEQQEIIQPEDIQKLKYISKNQKISDPKIILPTEENLELIFKASSSHSSSGAHRFQLSSVFILLFSTIVYQLLSSFNKKHKTD